MSRIDLEYAKEKYNLGVQDKLAFNTNALIYSGIMLVLAGGIFKHLTENLLDLDLHSVGFIFEKVSGTDFVSSHETIATLELNIMATLSIIFCFTCVVSMIYTFHLLFKSLIGYKYSYLPEPKKIEILSNETEKYYHESPKFSSCTEEEKEVFIAKNIEEIKYDYYCKCIKINEDSNDKKNNAFRDTGKSLRRTTYLFFITLILYYLA